MRRYVQPQKNPLTGKTAELHFDVIKEIWWNVAEHFAEDMKALTTSELLPEIRASGDRLFSSPEHPAFTVLEYESSLARAG